MAYAYRVKFSASLNASGDIVPGAAKPGFKTDALSAGVIYILIENPATSAWQICKYNTAAASGSRRTMIEESAGSPFATLPMSDLVATFIAPVHAYATSDTDGNFSVGDGAAATGGDNTVVGAGAEAQAAGNIVIGRSSLTDKVRHILIGNGQAFSDYYGFPDDMIRLGHFAGGAGPIIIGNGLFSESYSFNGFNGIAIGSGVPYTANDFFVAGDSSSPHFSYMRIATVVSTSGTTAIFTPSAGGSQQHLLLNSNNASTGLVTRVKGTVVTDISSDHTYRRVWDVDYAIGIGPTVLYSTFTVLHTGGAGTLSLSVSSAGVLSLTTGGAYTGLAVQGLLMASKLVG